MCAHAMPCLCCDMLSCRHVANASGLFWEAGDMDFTGPQMVLTLKLVSMAVSYQDAHSKQKEVRHVQHLQRMAAL